MEKPAWCIAKSYFRRLSQHSKTGNFQTTFTISISKFPNLFNISAYLFTFRYFFLMNFFKQISRIECYAALRKFNVLQCASFLFLFRVEPWCSDLLLRYSSFIWPRPRRSTMKIFKDVFSGESVIFCAKFWDILEIWGGKNVDLLRPCVIPGVKVQVRIYMGVVTSKEVGRGLLTIYTNSNRC